MKRTLMMMAAGVLALTACGGGGGEPQSDIAEAQESLDWINVMGHWNKLPAENQEGICNIMDAGEDVFRLGMAKPMRDRGLSLDAFVQVVNEECP